MTATTGSSTRSPRKAFVAGGILIGILGGVRLVTNEVTLASRQAETDGLRLKAEQRDREAQRVILLERELHASKSELQASSARYQASAAEVAALASRVGTLGAELGDYASAQQELEQARERTQGLAEAHARAEAQADLLAGKLRAAEAQAELHEQELARTRAEIGHLTGRVKDLASDLGVERTRANRSEGQLEQLESAGVNVARLTGERPMPRISAIVLDVDLAALPPVVLVDAGRSEGLEVRDLLYVRRNGQDVASLEVVEVRDDMSSTHVSQAARGVQPRTGDRVISKPGAAH